MNQLILKKTLCLSKIRTVCSGQTIPSFRNYTSQTLYQKDDDIKFRNGNGNENKRYDIDDNTKKYHNYNKTKNKNDSIKRYNNKHGDNSSVKNKNDSHVKRYDNRYKNRYNDRINTSHLHRTNHVTEIEEYSKERAEILIQKYEAEPMKPLNTSSALQITAAYTLLQKPKEALSILEKLSQVDETLIKEYYFRIMKIRLLDQTFSFQDNYHFFETLRGRGMSNLESLQVMIKYCFVEGKIEKAEEILEDMMAFGYLDMFSYEIIVAGYLKNNFLDKALYYCGEMRNRHLRLSFALSKSLISSCLKHSRFDEAVKLIMSANKNSKCLGEDLHEIVKIAFEIKNSENQQIILKELKHNPLFLSSTKEIAVEYVNSGELQQALEVLKFLNVHFEYCAKETCEMLILESVKHNHLLFSFHFLEEMDNRNILVDGKTFMSFWRGFETCVQPKFLFQHELRSVEEEDVDSSRDIEEQLSIGRRIGFATQISEKLKIPWPLEVKDDILFRSCNLGSEKNRQAYFNQLKAMDGFFDGDTVGLQALKKMFSKKNLWKYNNWLSLFECCKEGGSKIFDENLVSVVIKGYHQIGNSEKALLIFEESRNQGIHSSELYNLILKLLKKYRPGSPLAMKYSHEIQIYNVEITFPLLLSLLNVYQQNKLYPETLELVRKAFEGSKCEEIKHERSLHSYVFQILVQSVESHRLIHDYVTILKSSNVQFTTSLYNSLINACIKTDQIDEAFSYMEEMKKSGCISCDTITYTSLIKGAMKVKKTSLIIDFIEEMENSGVELDYAFYNCVIDGFCKNYHFELALEIFNGMKAEGKLFENERIYNVIIDGSFKNKNYDTAMGFYKEMTELGIKPDLYTYSILASNCARCGKSEQAEFFYGEIERNGLVPNAYTFGGISAGFLKSGDILLAEKYLKKARLANLFNATLHGIAFDLSKAMLVHRQRRNL